MLLSVNDFPPHFKTSLCSDPRLARRTFIGFMVGISRVMRQSSLSATLAKNKQRDVKTKFGGTARSTSPRSSVAHVKVLIDDNLGRLDWQPPAQTRLILLIIAPSMIQMNASLACATPRVLGLLWRYRLWDLENRTSAACSSTVWDTLWTMRLTAAFLQQLLSIGTKMPWFDL